MLDTNKLNQLKLDFFTRFGGAEQKEFWSHEEGKAYFLSKATWAIPRYVQVHKAWTVMLVRQGILKRDQGATILAALSRIGLDTIPEMAETYDRRYPKTLMQLERYLRDKIGNIASNVMLGRTLPPPHYRMMMREAILPLLEAVLEFRGTLLEYSEKHRDVVMPGYTHYFHAQPMTFGHYLLGFHEAIAHASNQLETTYASVNRCDLGCGALAGTSFEIDRALPARLLGFDGFIEHANYCVAGTDQAIDLICAMTNLTLPMGRTCTEMYTWCTFEWNMMEISSKLSETSNMMPQKKNPGLLEDIRSSVGYVMGSYNECCARGHNIQWGDSREVQQLSESTVPIAKKVTQLVQLYNKVIPEIILHPEQMLRYAQEGFSTCSELAAVLVREVGMPFRVTHAIVAEVVRRLIDKGKTAADTTPELVDEAAVAIIGEPVGLTEEQIKGAMDPIVFVETHDSIGGVAPKEVLRMVNERRKDLEAARRRQKDRLGQLEKADQELEAAVRELIGG
ncbi:argininosuccinate lyase [bacterium]|nr:argininosuccinate lyase [bacterium]